MLVTILSAQLRNAHGPLRGRGGGGEGV
jgi:hypothetical protein